MIQEIRIYDVTGEKRFITIDTELFMAVVQNEAGAIDITEAVEASIVADDAFYMPPSLFTIEFPMRHVCMRNYEHDYYEQRERRNQRAYTWFGAMVERIENACTRWLERP